MLALSVLLAASLGGLAALHLVPGLLSSVGSPRPTARRGSSTTSPARHATSSTVPPGAGPFLTSIAPASGGVGTTVTLRGVRLFSSDQVIQVTFGSVPGPVHCPTRELCVATAPQPSGGASAVPVRLRTDAGRSNPLTFHYDHG